MTISKGSSKYSGVVVNIKLTEATTSNDLSRNFSLNLTLIRFEKFIQIKFLNEKESQEVMKKKGERSREEPV
jgi:hypothetical protein